VSELPGLVTARGGGASYSVVDRAMASGAGEGTSYRVIEVRMDGREGSATPWFELESERTGAADRSRMRLAGGDGR
jgi:hypothetical protein